MPDIKTSRPLPTSRHFRLEQLSGGVFAAIATDEGAAVSNSGIIDLGGRTLIFDSFLTPQAAKDLRSAAEALTGQPVTCLINSHYHNDHIRGNIVFSAETEVMATTRTCHLIETKGIEELHWDNDNAASRLQALDRELQETEEPKERNELLAWIAYYKAILDSLPALKLRHPNWSFDQGVTFYGSRRKAMLVAVGPGHSEDDAYLYLPDDGIVFAGDLLFVGCHPYLAEGDLDAWLGILQKLEELGLQKLVPGHGPVGSPVDLALQRDYIQTLREMAAKAVQDGLEPSQAAEMPVPPAFANWRMHRMFRSNMVALYGRLAAA